MSSFLRGIFAVLIVACLGSALTPLSALADVGGARLVVQAAGSVGADEAAALVRRASGGRILDVRLDETARPPVYRVKVLLEGGRVRVYRVDARTGRILP